VHEALDGRRLSTSAIDGYDANETPEQAVERAASFWGDPELTPETVAALTGFAARAVAGAPNLGQRAKRRGWRQNALRQLIYFSPDLQTS
jgi:hypothetical protein